MGRRGVVGSVILAALVCLWPARVSLQGPQGSWTDLYRPAASALIARAQQDRFAWDRLAELTDTFGPRLSGSRNLEQAIAWAVAALERDGFEGVRTEPVLVPRWIRGRESLAIVDPGPRTLPMLGLGGSVGTPAEGIEAELLVVDSFEALEKRAADARGRIVLFDVAYTGYGETVAYRVAGASRAARAGAVAALVRAVGPVGLRTPHTGALAYAPDIRKIPAASISAEDAAMFSRLQRRRVPVKLRLSMEATMAPDAPSANVVAELRGRERPEEIVVIGGHFDSWDVGTGTSDDAVGCIAAWEAIRLMQVTGLRPRRTIRLVLFTNEENGLRGGAGYLDRHRPTLAQHVLMIESDLGVFPPLTMGFTGPGVARARVEEIGQLLAPLGIERIGPAGGGADIGPAAEAGNVPTLSIAGDMTRYFTIHHTAADTIDRVDPADVSRAAAALAVVAYIAADMAPRLNEAAGSR